MPIPKSMWPYLEQVAQEQPIKPGESTTAYRQRVLDVAADRWRARLPATEPEPYEVPIEVELQNGANQRLRRIKERYTP